MITERHTPEQQAAWQRHQEATRQTDLRLYGPNGPRGAVLREMSEEEQETWEEYQESLKTPEQKLSERIHTFVLGWWEQHVEDVPRFLEVSWYPEEETDEREDWVARGELGTDDRLFFVRLSNGYRKLWADIFCWIALESADQLRLVRMECRGLMVWDEWCPPGQIPEEIKEEVREFTRVMIRYVVSQNTFSLSQNTFRCIADV